MSAVDLGHNRPPESDLRDRFASEYAELIRSVEDVASRANDAPKACESDEDTGTLGGIAKEASALAKRLDAIRVAEKEPFLKAGREVDGFFKVLTDRLDRIRSTLTERAGVYLRAKAAEERRVREERARREREEAEARMREAAALEAENRKRAADAALDEAAEAEIRAGVAERAANAKAADLARTRSETNLATLKTEWSFEIVDANAIDLAVLRPFISPADIEKAVRAFVRAGHRDLAGVRIFSRAVAVVR